MIENIDFPVFVAWWNKTQNRMTPQVHFRLATWLSDRWHKGDDRLLLMAFRGCGKSTLVGLFGAWLLSIDPSLRIMVVSADEDLAHKMVRYVRRVIEHHPACTHLIPDSPDQWAADRFTVNAMPIGAIRRCWGPVLPVI